MAKRQNISSGSKFEEAFGYSRAVKVGDTLYISGTIGMDYAAGAMPEDPIGQLRQIIRNFEQPLSAAGASAGVAATGAAAASTPKRESSAVTNASRKFAMMIPLIQMPGPAAAAPVL